MSAGGNVIRNNTFNNISTSEYYFERIRNHMQDYYLSLPPEYFLFQQAPMIRAEMPNQNIWTNLTLEDNTFYNNSNVQSFTSSSIFRGMLVEMTSESL